MNSDNIHIIEKFVNSQESADIVGGEEHWNWDDLWVLLEPKLTTPLTEDEQQKLHDDLRDWWKQGNWGPDEQLPWGWGEWPWWTG